MRTTSEENNIMRISPIHLPFRNNSLQTSSISKVLSSFNKSRDDLNNQNIIPINMNQTIKNIGNYLKIINYQNKINYSTIPQKEGQKESDRGKFTNTILRGKFNFNPMIKKAYYRTIRYKPKRATNYPSLKLSIKDNKNIFQKGKIDIDKPLNRLKLENNIKSSDNILELYRERLDEDLINRDFSINDKKVINLKSQQISFFSKVSNDYTIFKKYINFISDKNKVTLNMYLTQLTNIIELQRNILFLDNINYNYLESPEKNDKDINKNKKDLTPNNKPKDKKRINIEEKKVHNLFNNKTMFAFLNNNTEYNTILKKCFTLVFTELKELKERNFFLEKINFENEERKFKANKGIEKNTNSDQTESKNKEDMENNTNNKINKVQNKYLLDNYRLNSEMKDLLLLLERNREYYNKYKELEAREKTNKSENVYIKAHLNNELEKKDAQYKNEIEINRDLNEQIISLEESINELKNTNENFKMKEIEYGCKIKRLFDIINERNETIRMMQEELDYYYMMYNKEMRNHENTKLLLLQKKSENRF